MKPYLLRSLLVSSGQGIREKLTTGGPLGNGGSFAYMGHFNHDCRLAWRINTVVEGIVWITPPYTKGYP
jgi:hypothetical protein